MEDDCALLEALLTMPHLKSYLPSKYELVYLYRPYDGELADVWSAGVVLYSMLEGTLPFKEENTKQLFNLIKHANYTFDKVLSPNAMDLINRMLQPNTFKRIKIAEIKEHPWFTQSVDESLFSYNLIYSKPIHSESVPNIMSLKHYAEDEKQLSWSHTEDHKQVKKPEHKRFTKRVLGKEVISKINKISWDLEDIKLPTEETDKDKPRISSSESMNTNATSGTDIVQLEPESPTTKEKDSPMTFQNGVSFKTDYKTMVETTFSALKDLKIVWKQLNSDFVFKCQTGVPKDAKKKHKEFTDKRSLKFFLQFSKVDRSREGPSTPKQTEVREKEYL